jgi:hypothetical protein
MLKPATLGVLVGIILGVVFGYYGEHKGNAMSMSGHGRRAGP